MSTSWTCLAIGGPLAGKWLTGQTWRTLRVLDPIFDTVSIHWVMADRGISHYIPRQVLIPGWRVRVVLYVHESLGLGEPEVPIGTILPGAVMGLTADSSPLCMICYARPTPGYFFCGGASAGVSHALLTAELRVMEKGL